MYNLTMYCPLLYRFIKKKWNENGSLYIRRKKKHLYRIFHFSNVVFFQKLIKIRKLQTELIENAVLQFSNSLLIIYGVNERPISKSVVANVINVLSTAVLHH